MSSARRTSIPVVVPRVASRKTIVSTWSESVCPVARNAFAYVFAGSGTFRDASNPRQVQTDHVGGPTDAADDAGNRSLVLFDTGDEIDFAVNERGDVVLRPVSLDIRDLRGLLKRPRRRAVTVAEMDAAILRHHARKR